MGRSNGPISMPDMPPTFRPKGQRTRRQGLAEYDVRRGTVASRGYGGRWQRESREHKRSNPLCVGCLAVGRYVAVAVTDHVIPHEGNDALMWDQGNWQSACDWHHNVIKQRLERMWKLGEITALDLRLDGPVAVRLTRERTDLDR